MLEHLARLSLVGFLQRKQRRGFIIPSNSAPKSFAVPAHDFERTPPALPDSNNGAASSAKRRRARAPQRSPRRSALELGLGYAMPRVKGSSPGFLCESIAEIVSRYGAVIGVDISSDLVARCKQRNQAEWLSYEVGDATQLALPNASFDVVVCTQVAEYLPDVNRGLSEAFRLVSKAAGVVSCNGLGGDCLALGNARSYGIAFEVLGSALRPSLFTQVTGQSFGQCRVPVGWRVRVPNPQCAMG